MQDRRDTGDEGYTKIDSEIARISPQEETLLLLFFLLTLQFRFLLSQNKDPFSRSTKLVSHDIS